MQLIQHVPEISAYLAVDEAIDHEHPLVRKTVADLGGGTTDAYTYAAAAYTLVRDTIAHSVDVGETAVTWRASDVLAARDGICHAKSHALAALLRAAGIPTALCYQRLAGSDGGPGPLHGLVAVRLPGRDRWERLDARGNKPGVDARFSLDVERLAWPVRPEFHEEDYPLLHAVPHPAVLSALRAAEDRAELWRMLPTEL